jgi:hypothetical protein
MSWLLPAFVPLPIIDEPVVAPAVRSASVARLTGVLGVGAPPVPAAAVADRPRSPPRGLVVRPLS